ncbi:hypothetical protein [Streptomyces sp. NPDC020681]|uniref:hypothetical protein n=1 Tax=Streptomyces sp. NPDC020681 TaxID=3365083 RepID=UPI0037BC9BCD
MGVFSRFRRKSNSTAEAPAEDTAVGTLTAEPPADCGSEAEASKDVEEPKDDEKSKDDAAEATETGEAEVAEATVTEGVEIPKQQSVEEAADNEAGEGARK